MKTPVSASPDHLSSALKSVCGLKGHIGPLTGAKISVMSTILAKRLSVNQRAAETGIFQDGVLSEAPSSNVWVVKDGEVIGTPKGPLVLEGIRYGLMSQLCAANSIPFVLKAQTKEEVRYLMPMNCSSLQHPKKYCPSPVLTSIPFPTDVQAPFTVNSLNLIKR